MKIYYEDERLYSTGNYELDSLLEKAFCDGYEYAQREYAASKKAAKYFMEGGFARDLKKAAENPVDKGIWADQEAKTRATIRKTKPKSVRSVAK